MTSLTNRIEYNTRAHGSWISISPHPASLEKINSRLNCVTAWKAGIEERRIGGWNCVAARHGELNYSATSRHAWSVSVTRVTSLNSRTCARSSHGDKSRWHESHVSTILINRTSCSQSCYRIIEDRQLSAPVWWSAVLIIAFADRLDQRKKFGVENEFKPLQTEQYMYIAYHNVINISNSLHFIKS